MQTMFTVEILAKKIQNGRSLLSAPDDCDHHVTVSERQPKGRR